MNKIKSLPSRLITLFFISLVLTACSGGGDGPQGHDAVGHSEP